MKKKTKKGYSKGGKTKKGYSMGGALGSAPPILPGSGAIPMESEDERKKRMMRPNMNMGMKKGGEAKFPDLSGDGEVTQKDILIGKGVIKKAGGGMAKKGYAKGGMAKKGYSKGGATKKGSAKGGKKSKVRGAGIARKGVRPAKMR